MREEKGGRVMFMCGCMQLCKKGSLSLIEDLQLVPIQDAPH